MKLFSIILTVAALFSVLLLGGAVVLANAQKHPSPPVLQGSDAEMNQFVIGGVQFNVPTFYLEGGTVPDEMMGDWKREKRMASAKFRNIFDGKCYKECTKSRGYGEMNVSISKTARDAEIYNSENLPCQNPEELPANSSYKTNGVPCQHAFNYRDLLVNVRFTTGDYPRQSIPEMERRLRVFLDRFAQPIPSKGE
jgi:hypothetical protein